MNEDHALFLKDDHEAEAVLDIDILHNTNFVPPPKLNHIDNCLKEVECSAFNGCVMLTIGLIFSILIIPICIILPGLFTVTENEVAIITQYGKYYGTIKKPGYYWICGCFKTSRIISLKQQSSISTTLKVNDQQGNPIEIQMSMIWRVAFPTEAVFKVQNYFAFIKLQSESALKEMAALFPYDTNDDNQISLLRNIRQVNEALKKELNDRFRIAGIVCDEAAIVHLRYPDEIAKTLLQKQQADALIAAKDIITKGVVGIALNCIGELEKDIKMSSQDRADLANELIMVLTDTNESRSKNYSLQSSLPSRAASTVQLAA